MQYINAGIGLSLMIGLSAEAVFTTPVILRHDREDARALELARPFDITGPISASGCGTLIAPTWVLTAAHIARGVSPFAAHVRFGDQTVPIKRIIIHPEGIANGRTPPRVDLALIELERPVLGIKPAILHPEDDELGREVIVVGYGDYGLGGVNPDELTPSDGRRRAVTNVVSGTMEHLLFLTFDEPPDGTDLEGMGAPGDSGGPLLFVNDQEMVVIGVSSGSSGEPGPYGLRDIYMRVSHYLDWIQGSMTDPPPTMIKLGQPRDLGRNGFPDTAVGHLAQAFIEVFNSADEQQLIQFSLTNRLEDARLDTPDEDWATEILKRRSDMGRVQALECIERSPERFEVLVLAAKTGRRRLLRFIIQPGDRIKLEALAFRRG